MGKFYGQMIKDAAIYAKNLGGLLGEVSPKTKILFMSGYPDEEISKQGVLEDGINFLQKPFSVLELGQKIYEILGKSA